MIRNFFFAFLLKFYLQDSNTSSDTDTSQCGYYGSPGEEIETKLDECFTENIKDSRVRMALGYEICFGYNYKKLNDTVAGPVNDLIKEQVEEIYKLGQTSCRISQEVERPMLNDVAIDYKTERKMIGNCKKFFDLVATAFQNEQQSLLGIMDDKDYLLKNFYESDDDLLNMKNNIKGMMESVQECYTPMKVTRDKLISKYLTEFLTALTEPTRESYNNLTLDTLLHPDNYVVQNHDSDLPDFQNFNYTDPRKVYQEKRKIRIEPINSKLESFIEDIQDLNDTEFKEKFNDMEQWSEGREADLQVPTRKSEGDFIFSETDDDEKEDLKNQKIQIDNFWNQDVKMRSSRTSDEDFKRYQIEDWDVTDNIDKMFRESKHLL